MIILRRNPPSKFFPDFRKFHKASQILKNLGTCSQISEISIEKVTVAQSTFSVTAEAVRLGCHLYAKGAYDQWATSSSLAARPGAASQQRVWGPGAEDPQQDLPSASPSREGTQCDEFSAGEEGSPNHPAALRLGILRGSIPWS